MRRALALGAAAVGLAGAACHRAAAPEPADSLAGQVLALLPGPGLAVEASVEGRPARAELDVARPLSTASPGCFGAEVPREAGEARAPEPAGGLQAWRLVPLHGARLGTARLGGRVVGLAGAPGCRLTLGADVLRPYALEVDPVRRQVTLTPSRPRAAHRAVSGPGGERVDLLELARDPRGDWPLVAVRVEQAGGAFVAPFVLGTREAVSRLSAQVAQQRGLTLAPDGARLEVDALELARGVGTRGAVLHVDAAWTPTVAVGLLAPDVWGRFHATLDVQGGVLLLRRPEGIAGDAPAAEPVPALPAGEPEPEDPP